MIPDEIDGIPLSGPEKYMMSLREAVRKMNPNSVYDMGSLIRKARQFKFCNEETEEK